MPTIFRLPRIQAMTPIVDAAGKAKEYFLRFLDEAFTRIETNENAQNQIIADLQAAFAAIQAIAVVAQAAQQTANEALAVADAAGGGTVTSGSMTGSALPVDMTWAQGPQVDLTGVVAGTLTIPGSGPLQDDSLSSDVTISGQYRVVEIVGITETEVFNGGTYRVYAGSPQTVLNETASIVTAFSAAATSTGAVSYRIDFNRTDGGAASPVTVAAYLYVRRA